MLQYSSDNHKWKVALRQTEFLYQNKLFTSQLYKHFDHKYPINENLKFFIPILCIENIQEENPVIKLILENDKDSKHFDLFMQVAKWINKTNPVPYANSIKIFLQIHGQTEYLKKSAIYPNLLCALCKASDTVGYQLSLDYLNSLKKPSSVAQREMALELFRAENPKAFTIDELIVGMKVRISEKKK